MRQVKQERISTVEVQGEGSFVVVRPPKWGLLRKAQQQAKAEDKGEAGVTFAEDLLKSTVVEWNWTDDQGNQLPIPREVPEVIDDLDSDEVAFLVEKISGAFSGATGN